LGIQPEYLAAKKCQGKGNKENGGRMKKEERYIRRYRKINRIQNHSWRRREKAKSKKTIEGGIFVRLLFACSRRAQSVSCAAVKKKRRKKLNVNNREML
jgi:hypothetical protein